MSCGAHIEYAEIEGQLRKMGFENDIESNVICRYRVQGIVVDVMPTGENVLGFNNIWYADGYTNAVDYVIDKQHTVKIFSAPYFIPLSWKHSKAVLKMLAGQVAIFRTLFSY